jgi:hypothetical protein
MKRVIKKILGFLLFGTSASIILYAIYVAMGLEYLLGLIIVITTIIAAVGGLYLLFDD